MQSSASVSKMCLWLVFFKFFWKMYFGLLKHLILRGYTEKRIVRFLSEKKEKKSFSDLTWKSQEQLPEVLCKKGVLRPATLLKKRLWHKCFPVNFAKFLRTPFSVDHLRWLLLKYLKKVISVFNYKLFQYLLNADNKINWLTC